MQGSTQQPEFNRLSQQTSPHQAGTISPTPHSERSWLAREELFLRVMVRICIGPVVAIAPWSPTLWDRNPLFLIFPTLAIYASNGAVRGLVTGLGLLTLWFALRETMQGREHDESRKKRSRQEP